MSFLKRRSKALTLAALTLTSAAIMTVSAQARAQDAASAPREASDSIASLLSANALPPNFAGDDPEQVRDALSGHLPPATRAPSIANRVRTFLEHPLRQFRQEGQAASAPRGNAQTSRTFLFVIPASYGVRYESKRKLLSVNVSLASSEQPGALLLKQTVTGQSGRKLVIAPEAKAKGYIQTFDTILFKTDETSRTNVQGRAVVPNFEASRNEDFAIVLVCTLEPPYMTERNEHSDPTDEEPTDITRRTSTLQGVVDAVWLIDRKDGAIVTKRLRLVK